MGKRGFGNVRRLPSGRWQVRYRNPVGDLVPAPQTFRTKAEGDRWLRWIESELMRGDYRDPMLARTRFDHWAEAWFATTTHLKPRTRTAYRSLVDRHLLPQFGKEAVGGIDTPTVRAYLHSLLASGMPHGTVVKVRAVLRLVLATAVEGGAIKANPVTGIRLGRPVKAEKVFLTPDQVHDLATAIEYPVGRTGRSGRTYPELGLLVTFAAYTGLRAGEIAALTVRSLDLMRGRVAVLGSLGEVQGEGLVRGTTKSSEERTVPIPGFLIEPLTALVAGRALGEPLFTMPGGGPIRQTNFLKRYFRAAVLAASLPSHMRFHDLRHTYAALMIHTGAHPLSIKERMGHSSITVTMNVYGHLFPQLEQELDDRLDALGRSARPSPQASIRPLDAPSERDGLARPWHDRPNDDDGGALVGVR